MEVNTDQELEIRFLKTITKEFESNPTNTLTTLDRRISALLQDENFECFWRGLQIVHLRVKDLQVKILNRKEIDFPIEAIGLFNLIGETREALLRRFKDREITNRVSTALNRGAMFGQEAHQIMTLCQEPLTHIIKENKELSEAIRRNDVSRIRALLLANPASVNERGRWKLLFHLVCEAASSSVIDLFIRAGANVNFSFFNQPSPISLVFRGLQPDENSINSLVEKLKLLLDAGADPNAISRVLKSGIFGEFLNNTPPGFLIPALSLLANAGLDLNFGLVRQPSYLHSVLTRRSRQEDISKTIQALVFYGANVGEEEEKVAKNYLAELQCFVKIRQEASNQLRKLIVTQLAGFSNEIFALITSYHTPNLREQADLCYKMNHIATSTTTAAVDNGMANSPSRDLVSWFRDTLKRPFFII